MNNIYIIQELVDKATPRVEWRWWHWLIMV
jgi:hypothetical protein